MVSLRPTSRSPKIPISALAGAGTARPAVDESCGWPSVFTHGAWRRLTWSAGAEIHLAQDRERHLREVDMCSRNCRHPQITSSSDHYRASEWPPAVLGAGGNGTGQGPKAGDLGTEARCGSPPAWPRGGLTLQSASVRGQTHSNLYIQLDFTVYMPLSLFVIFIPSGCYICHRYHC